MCLTLFRFSIKTSSGFFVNLLTMYVINTLTMKPGIISYIPKNALIAAKGLIQEIQTITTTAPATIPLIAPARVKSFQYKE